MRPLDSEMFSRDLRNATFPISPTMNQSTAFFPRLTSLTEPFTIFEPQDPTTDELNAVQKSLSTVLRLLN